VTNAVARWLHLEGTANTRDIGGFPAAGGRIRPGLLIRSDNLQELTPADVDLLVDLGVRTVLDLRTDSERIDEGPAPLEARQEVVHLTLSFIPDRSLERADPGMVLPDRWADGAVGAYLHYLRDMPESFASAIRRLADPVAGGSLVHCAAGKDRTGVLVALVLDTLGTDRSVIYADYERTNEQIERIFERLSRSKTYAVAVQRIGLDAHRVDPRTMEAVLGIVDERFGGAAGYFRSIGVTDVELAQLAERLVE
jgi:protein-tyrosine phosphatase